MLLAAIFLILKNGGTFEHNLQKFSCLVYYMKVAGKGKQLN